MTTDHKVVVNETCSLLNETCSFYQRYERIKCVGEGAYGVVYKCRERVTNNIVAVKEILDTDDDEDSGIASTTIREISILKELNHRNIVRLQDVVHVHSKKEMYLIFEFIDLDLAAYMVSPEFVGDPIQVKTFLHQILCGISHCHSRRVLHRDLKPNNLLIDRSTNSLKLADFGLSRDFSCTDGKFTLEVGTQGFIAPEILLGSSHYSTAVDIWSIGCIFAEMVNRESLFKGGRVSHQLSSIFRKLLLLSTYCSSSLLLQEGKSFKIPLTMLMPWESILGAPNEDTWPGVTLFPAFSSRFSKYTPKDLATVVPKLEPAGLNLLSRMLCLNPSERIDAKSALQHEYFKDIKLVP